MKLSTDTKALLKSLSRIQPDLIIQPGNVIYARTPAVYAEATVAEMFPTEVRIANVHEFLRMLALFGDPELHFTDEHIRISEGSAELLYSQAKPGLIVQSPRPTRDKIEPPEQIVLKIAADQWMAILKALGISTEVKKSSWEPKRLSIVSDGQTIRVVAERGHGKPQYSLIVDGVTNGLECKSTFDASYLPIVPGPYGVMVANSFARFVHTGEYNLRHFVGSEPNLSTWGGKRNFSFVVTKGTMQDCRITVLAHSPEEAEAIARQTREQDFAWTEQTRTETSFKVIGA
jgi:hypothetical protein